MSLRSTLARFRNARSATNVRTGRWEGGLFTNRLCTAVLRLDSEAVLWPVNRTNGISQRELVLCMCMGEREGERESAK